MTLPPAPHPTAYVELTALPSGEMSLPENFVRDGGHEDRRFHIPDYAFLIKHQGSGRRVLWDTGIAKDFAVYPPAVHRRMAAFHPIAPKSNIAERLFKSGIDPDSVDTVIFSHAHWDHMQPIHHMFKNATAILGPGSTEYCAPGYPKADSTFFGEFFDSNQMKGLVRELSLEQDEWQTCGPFEHAYDFFGDGSLMLCSAPGHIPGNMAAIARVGNGRHVVLGGDCAHHRKLVSGEWNIGHWRSDDGALTSMHLDIEKARATIKKLAQLQEDGCVIALAHDEAFKWPSVIE